MRIIKLLLLSIVVVSFLMAAGCSCPTKSATGGGDTGISGGEPTPPVPPVEPPAVTPPVEAPPGGDQKAEPVEPGRDELALKDVYFDFDKFEVNDSEKPALQANADWMKANPASVVVIEGHCDERGTVEYNLALGERRAEAAMNYLVSLGVNPDKMKTISYGKSKPVDPGHDEAAWAKNRRAHFVVQH